MQEEKELNKNCIKVLNIYRDAIVATNLYGSVPKVWDGSNNYFICSCTGCGIEVFANRRSETHFYFTDDLLELNFKLDFLEVKFATRCYKRLKKILTKDFVSDVELDYYNYRGIGFSLYVGKKHSNKTNHYQRILNIVERTDDKRIIGKIIKILTPKFSEIYEKYIKLIFNAVVEVEQDLILQGLIEGLTYKQIKEKYGITLYTNDERVLSLYKKYSVTNRVQLCKKIKRSAV